MATQKQRTAARRNIRNAQRVARKKRTIAHLPKATRADLGRQAAKAAKRKRGQLSGRSLEDRTRQELHDVARRRGIEGRSKMGKWDLIRAIRKAG